MTGSSPGADPFEIRVRPCLRSGFCCKKTPCAYGAWNADRTGCAHLVVTETLANGAELHACGLYDEIVKMPGADMYPAFGGGCCMPLFNDLREKIIEGLREERNGRRI